jgi:isopenicillin N synthase-like dioxygenase
VSTLLPAAAGAISCPQPIQERRVSQTLSEISPRTLPNSVAGANTSTGIPLLDVAGYLAGEPGALEATAAELCYALENIGFFYLTGHGVPQELIDRVFAQTKRFHSQPLDEKLKLKLNRSNNGYMPLRGHAQRHTSLNKDPKPNENESFFAKRERDPADPDVKAGRDLRDPNQWPADMPGFKETVLEYQDVMRRLVHKLLPVYARALDLPADYFAPFFHTGGEITVRMIHYPPATPEQVDDKVFGTAAHTDRNLFTVLAQGDTPGLQIMLPNGSWRAGEAGEISAGDHGGIHDRIPQPQLRQP